MEKTASSAFGHTKPLPISILSAYRSRTAEKFRSIFRIHLIWIFHRTNNSDCSSQRIIIQVCIIRCLYPHFNIVNTIHILAWLSKFHLFIENVFFLLTTIQRFIYILPYNRIIVNLITQLIRRRHKAGIFNSCL